MASPRRIIIIVIACLAGALLGVLAQSAGEVGQAGAAPSAQSARLTLRTDAQPMPRSFFGLSIEYDELADYEALGPAFSHVLGLIRPQDGTRMLLRIGGKSADRTYYVTKPEQPVPFGRPIGEQWLQNLAAMVRPNALRLMLDLNLAVHSPTEAVSFVQAAKQELRSSFFGVVVGNEPDLYWRQTFLTEERIPSTDSKIPRLWTRNYSAADYRRDYSSYADALVTKVPGLQIGGPEIISSKPQWLSAVEGLGREDPSFLTIHRYAGSTCFPATSPFYPTIPGLLNERASFGLGDTIRNAAAFAHSHDQALRIDEINSISCGGNAGVANSFATALWAPDALFELVRDGAASVSWHIRPKALNAPFHLTGTGTGIDAMPELYGLAVFAQMTRPGARIVSSSLSAAGGLHLKAWVVRFGSSLRVLLINKGPRAANVALHLGAAGTAFIRRLTAPRIGSSNGVTFGGQRIGTDGLWHGHRVQTVIHGRAGVYGVAVPGYSAALVSAR